LKANERLLNDGLIAKEDDPEIHLSKNSEPDWTLIVIFRSFA